jgi:hypothetical protein
MNVRVVAAVALLVALAGCLGPLASFDSSPAAVASDAADAEGYGLLAASDVPLIVPLYFGPIGGDVRVTGYVTVYGAVPDASGNDSAATTGGTAEPEGTGADAADVDPAAGDAVLFVLSTPDEEVFGLSANPFAHLSNQELLTTVVGTASDLNADLGVGSVANLRVTGSTAHPVLGSTVDVVSYDGTLVAENGTGTAVRLHLATVRHEGDVVVVVGLHGDGEGDDDARDALLRLVSAVEHPVPRDRLGPTLSDRLGNATGFGDLANRTTPAPARVPGGR